MMPWMSSTTPQFLWKTLHKPKTALYISYSAPATLSRAPCFSSISAPPWDVPETSAVLRSELYRVRIDVPFISTHSAHPLAGEVSPLSLPSSSTPREFASLASPACLLSAIHAAKNESIGNRRSELRAAV
ncbi:hypothetical protein OPQ81_002201 [Rhizoctonia solani]|nr:hypothetical protein OPQ81_002201 [Rhizoctonia solani]